MPKIKHDSTLGAFFFIFSVFPIIAITIISLLEMREKGGGGGLNKSIKIAGFTFSYLLHKNFKYCLFSFSVNILSSVKWNYAR